MLNAIRPVVLSLMVIGCLGCSKSYEPDPADIPKVPPSTRSAPATAETPDGKSGAAQNPRMQGPPPK